MKDNGFSYLVYRGMERTKLRYITLHHEQGAGCMAAGYARVTGKPAACFIITGPGMTNIATAMARAYGDSVPTLYRCLLSGARD